MRPLLLLLSLVVACAPPAPPAGEATPADRAIPVATELVREGTVADPVQVTGTVVPSREAMISAEGAGRVLAVEAGLGDDVARGAVLARLDATIAEAQLDQARANLRAGAARLDLARSGLARADELLAEGATSHSARFSSSIDVESAEAGVDAAKAGVTLAERAVSDARIRAPWAGTVAAVALDEGALIGPGTPAFKLVALDPLRVEAGVPARDVGLVQPGQIVRLTFPAEPGPPREGVVARVGPEADPRSRTFPVEIEVPNPDRTLRSGMVARAEIVVGERQGVTLVPEGAVVATDPPAVYAIADGRARRVEVQLGRAWQGFVEVSGGVAPGESVATLGRQHLSDGCRVTDYDLAPAAEEARAADAKAPPPDPTPEPPVGG
jgi:membrane fusion protein (multidrug efflux system)